MDIKETAELLTSIQSYYNTFKVGASEKERSKAYELLLMQWFEDLQDYNYQDIKQSYKIYRTTDTSGFPPRPSHLIAGLKTVEDNTHMNENEAWALVSSALRDGYYHANEQFQKLGKYPLVQKAVGSPENLRNWAQSDYKDIETVISSNFMRTYRGLLEKEKRVNKMPQNIQALISATTKANTPQLATKTTEPIKLTDGSEKGPETRNTMPQWAIDKIREMKGE